MTPRRATSLLGCLLGLSCIGLTAQTPLPEQPRPIFPSRVDLVTVETTVLDRGGGPLAGLTAGDFDVKVDGTPRTVVSAQQIRADEARGAEPAAASLPASQAAPDARLFVLVVDRDHIAAGEGRQMLDAATRFIDGLPPNDRVALWTIPVASGGLRFASDRAALKQDVKRAVGTYRPPMLGGLPGRPAFNISTQEALMIDQGQTDVLEAVTLRECLRLKAPDSPAGGFQNCPNDIPIAARTVANDARQRAQTTLTGISTLLQAVSQIDAPKHLLLITGGPVSANFEEQGLINLVAAQAADTRVTIHALQVREAPAAARTDSMALTNMPTDQSLSASYFLAGMTGGLAITPASGDVAFTQLTKQLSVTYLLAFAPSAEDRDGRSHTIQVEVKGHAGASVRARRQFRIAASAAGATSAAAPIAPPTASSAAGTAAAGSAAPPAAPVAPTRAEPAKAAPLEADTRRTATAPPESVSADPEVRQIVDRMAAYVARYGETAEFFVASERYHQRVELQSGRMLRPRMLTSEFAIVRTPGDVGWTGFRDVLEVDGRQVTDRRDRLERVLTSREGGVSEAKRIAAESARFNIGPVARDFNVPTTVLLFFHPSRVGRFSFKSRGSTSVDGVRVAMLDFKEVARPTLVGRRDGTDVPCEGRVWVVPEDGTVVRTRVRLRNFADVVRVDDRAQLDKGARPGDEHGATEVVAPPASPPAAPPPSAPAPGGPPPPTGGGGAVSGPGGGATGGTTSFKPAPERQTGTSLNDTDSMVVLESSAEVEVTFRRDPRYATWLPWKMSELYEGAIPLGTRQSVEGKATATAEYTDYRKFTTSATIVEPR